MQDQKSCILLANPFAHVWKSIKKDFLIQHSVLQRINLQRVNSDQLHSWIKWRLEREEDWSLTYSLPNDGNGHIEESNGYVMLSQYK